MMLTLILMVWCSVVWCGCWMLWEKIRAKEQSAILPGTFLWACFGNPKNHLSWEQTITQIVGMKYKLTCCWFLPQCLLANMLPRTAIESPKIHFIIFSRRSQTANINAKYGGVQCVRYAINEGIVDEHDNTELSRIKIIRTTFHGISICGWLGNETLVACWYIWSHPPTSDHWSSFEVRILGFRRRG